MTQSAYSIGYDQPPEHRRSQTGHSGNPGGRAGLKKRLRAAFDAAFSDALTADKNAFLESRPARVMEAFVRALVVDALDGRASAQRLVLGILEQEDVGGAEACEEQPDARAAGSR